MAHKPSQVALSQTIPLTMESKSAAKTSRFIDPKMPTKMLIALTFGYQLAFNYVPNGSRVLAGTALGALWVMWSLWHSLNRRVATTAPYLAFVILALCCVLQQFELGAWQGTWQGFARYSTWILAMPGLLSLDFSKLMGLLQKMALAMLGLSLFVALSKGTILLDSLYRRGIFTGGEDGAHASGLTMASCTLILFATWYCKRNLTNFVLFTTGLLLLIQIRVSTAQLVTLIPIAWTLASGPAKRTNLYQKAISISARGRAFLLSTASLGAIVFYHETVSNKSKTLANAGSGRLGTWIERLQTFSVRDSVTKLIGTGPYSDIQISSIWWWSAKNAHNDVLTLLMEFGIFGIVVYCLIISCQLRRFTDVSFGLVLAFIFGTLTSNAYLSRPIITIILFLAFGAVREALLCAQKTEDLKHPTTTGQ